MHYQKLSRIEVGMKSTMFDVLWLTQTGQAGKSLKCLLGTDEHRSTLILNPGSNLGKSHLLDMTHFGLTKSFKGAYLLHKTHSYNKMLVYSTSKTKETHNHKFCLFWSLHVLKGHIITKITVSFLADSPSPSRSLSPSLLSTHTVYTHNHTHAHTIQWWQRWAIRAMRGWCGCKLMGWHPPWLGLPTSVINHDILASKVL